MCGCAEYWKKYKAKDVNPIKNTSSDHVTKFLTAQIPENTIT